MDFTSDNASGVAPEIMDALIRANEGQAASYGADRWSSALDQTFSALFETEVRVFPVLTGTAANALALAQVAPPWGAVFCHQGAHLYADECGAPEFFSAGAKLVPVAGDDGKVTPGAFRTALSHFTQGAVHEAQPAVLSLSEASEEGTVYTPDEIATLAGIAHERGLKTHMDGARLANALAGLGVAPAAATWRAGVDVLSLGATKTGALMAEAVIFFEPSLAESFVFRRKRAGQLLSKSRFLSAQLLAYVQDGLWLRLARHANAMAQHLAQGFSRLTIPLVHPVEANEVFARLPPALAAALRAQGAAFYDWPAPGIGPDVYRFVTSFATKSESVEQLLALVEKGY